MLPITTQNLTNKILPTQKVTTNSVHSRFTFSPPGQMEVFTGDHGLPYDVVLFSDTHFSPFSLPTSDTFSDHHKISISADHSHFPPPLPPPPPPQKLRPIRSNVRSFSDRCSSDDPVDAKTLSWQPGGDGGGGVPPNCSDLGLGLEEGRIEAALSPSSSDETSKLQEANQGPINKKKRKRKSRRKMELFVESMMKTVIEKQEEMQKQLIEILEQKEKESIIREQAWKKQELERAKKDEQARKQQVSHCLALISFIQNTLGQEIQIPNPPEVDKQTENHESDAAGNDDIEMNNIEESECDPNTKRWPKSEVQALITVRVALNHKFDGKGPKGSIWDEVAAGLSGMGYNRSPKKCKEKWENINKYYRRTMDKGKGKSKSCSYFSELEMLYKTGFISAISYDEDQSNQGQLALEYK